MKEDTQITIGPGRLREMESLQAQFAQVTAERDRLQAEVSRMKATRTTTYENPRLAVEGL